MFGYAPFYGRARLVRLGQTGSATRSSVMSMIDILTKAPQGCRDQAGSAAVNALIAKMNAFLASGAQSMDVTMDESNLAESVKACSAAVIAGAPIPSAAADISPWAIAAGGLIVVGTIAMILKNKNKKKGR